MRSGTAQLAIMMALGIPIVAIVGGLFVEALKVLKGKPSSKTAELSQEETRLIQDVHQGLVRMEKRVEALETILMDRARPASTPRAEQPAGKD